MNSSLQEDAKKFRKLRKIMRQIEHLKLLSRPLNKDENLKCSKRDFYRKELNALNEKYLNTDLLILELNKNKEDNSLGDEDDSNLFIKSNYTFENDKEATEEVGEILATSKGEEVENEKESVEKSLPSILSNQCKINEIETKIKNDNVDKTQFDRSRESKKSILNKAKDKPVDLPKVESKPNKTKSEPKSEQFQQNQKLKVSFNHLSIPKAHDDLVLSLDINVESNLIVTASRDTTIKVWHLESGKLIHSFGGHTGSITCVRFWAIKSYLKTVENLNKIKNSDFFEDEDNLYELEDSLNEEDLEENKTDKSKKEYPFVLSSSLDCSFCIWSIYKGKCLKQFYLYNRINFFEISDTSFLIGMDAGKVEFIRNLQQTSSSKILDDTDSVRCIKLLNNESFYALTQNGNLALIAIKQCKLELQDKVDIYLILSKCSTKFTRNFKYFELINENKLIILNDHQSFVILYDFAKRDEFKLVSTNASSYGFTNCLFRLNNKYFINSFNIDYGLSSINVFESETDETKKSDPDLFKYKYTIQDENDDNSFCISAISCSQSININEKELNDKKVYSLVTTSNNGLKVWKLQEFYLSPLEFNKSKVKDQGKYIKMSTKINLHDDDDDDSEIDDKLESIQKDQDKDSEQNIDNKLKSYCLIQ